MQSSRKHTGNLGESLAAAYLQQQGYAILATNWHCPNGEIDIVAQRDDTLVFVEVKTRRSGGLDAAFNSITSQKRQRLIDSAYNYIHGHQFDDPVWRIDLIAIALRRGEPPLIDHRENALDW